MAFGTPKKRCPKIERFECLVDTTVDARMMGGDVDGSGWMEGRAREGRSTRYHDYQRVAFMSSI